METPNCTYPYCLGNPPAVKTIADILLHIGGPVLLTGILTLIILSPMIFCEIMKKFTGESMMEGIRRALKDYEERDHDHS